MLTINEALEIIKAKNERRYNHVYGTYKMASYLANKYNVNVFKCEMAAILHDYAKNESIEYMQEIIKKHLDINELKFNKATYHGIVGAFLVKERLKIDDNDILEAIKYHVTGAPNMSDYAKIVYIADYTEVNRKHEGKDFARYLSEISLDLAVVGIAEKTLQFLYNTKSENIHPRSIETYNKFLEKVGTQKYDTIKNNYESSR